MPMPISFTLGQSPLGEVLVAGTEAGLSAVLLGDNVDELIADAEHRFGKHQLTRNNLKLKSVYARVIASLNDPKQSFDGALSVEGSPFQQSVWQILQSIPAGSTLTYSEIAEKLGRPQSARAVANACGANPVAVIIPCHRVLRRDGTLGGYRWGLERKRQLLKMESTLS